MNDYCQQQKRPNENAALVKNLAHNILLATKKGYQWNVEGMVYQTCWDLMVNGKHRRLFSS